MATLGKFTGTAIGVTVDGTRLGHITQHTIDYTVATTGASDKDSQGTNEYLPSFQDGTMSFDGFVVYNDATDDNFFDLFTAGILNRTIFTLVMGTTETGDTVITQDAILTGLSKNASAEETVTYNGTFQFTGKPTTSVNA